MLPTIHFFGLSVSTYWSMFVVGVVGIVILCGLRAAKYRMSLPKAVLYALLLTVSGLLGTKVLYILENWQDTLTNGISLGGQSFFGALFLVPILMALIGRAFRLSPSESTDYVAAPVIFILMCMRMGCMLNGCCGGIMIGDFQVPTQMLEACFDAVIFVILWECEKKERKKGKLYPIMMVLYGIIRFFLEFVRNTSKDWLSLSHGQWFSIAAVIYGVIWLICQEEWLKKHVRNLKEK